MQIPFERYTALGAGATSGTGLETCKLLQTKGMRIDAVGREPARRNHAEHPLRRHTKDARISFLLADLAIKRQICLLAEQLGHALDETRSLGVDASLHVAGIYADRRLSTDSIELYMAVNHLAPLLLNTLLLPRPAIARGWVILVTSPSLRQTWLRLRHLNQDCLVHDLWAYKVSKLACILCTGEFTHRYQKLGVVAVCLDPGLVDIAIGCKATSLLERFIWERRQRKGMPPGVPVWALLQLVRLPRLNGYYWHEGQPELPGQAARNPRLMSAVWKESAALCGIKLSDKET